MKSFLSFMSGVLSGAVVGAAVALLLAPASGDDLRTDAVSRYEGMLSDLKTSIEGERRRLEEELEALKQGEIKIS